ncbi:ribonuclease III [Parafrankia elaeagni]|uniref:ribonuclease III n=1 Tax=Parafrankia elaeagni TaxID=222534 RepID=UPI000382ADD6|nr:ribonuclease III [Parafrankia elaeagni]
MSRAQSVPPPREGLVEALQVNVDPELLDRALTHRSYAYENGGLPTNERLEFLGDAVLGLIVTAALFRRHPDLPEGQLAKQRASVVNMRALAEVARRLGPAGIGPYLLLGRGEEATGGRDKPSILADTLEAVIGAVYLSNSLDVASDFVHRLFDPLLDEAAGRGAGLDWKTSLQEQTALLGLGPPDYVVTEAGPDHAKRFTAFARVAGEVLGEGEGGSKKEAEQRAAATAFAVLEKRSAESAGAELRQDAERPMDAAGASAGSAGSAASTPAGDPGARAGEPR